MLLHIPGVFSKDRVATLQSRLDAGPWVNGNVTSGHQSATAKVNRQLPEDSVEAREVGALVMQALQANPMFVSAALPHTIFPPLFNAYEGGERFDVHVDNAIRQRGSVRIRSDLSATLFLSETDDSDRETLFRLDVAIQRVSAEKGPKDTAVLELTAVYHNLMRRWAAL